MGLPILIEGESGAGKTYSIKNLDADAVGIFAVEKSRLPFKKAFRVAKNANYGAIMKVLQNPTLKTYIIDDSQYLMVNEFFDRAKDTGYQKYTDIGLNFRNLVHFINHNLPDDVHVYFLHHTETDSNTGNDIQGTQASPVEHGVSGVENVSSGTVNGEPTPEDKTMGEEPDGSGTDSNEEVEVNIEINVNAEEAVVDNSEEKEEDEDDNRSTEETTTDTGTTTKDN